MNDRIEALAQRLVADMEITRSAGHRVSPGGYYRPGEAAWGCAVCLLGAVLVAEGIEYPGPLSCAAIRQLGLSISEGRALEAGFCWPQPQAKALTGHLAPTGPEDQEYFALGKRLREDVLAQRTIQEPPHDAIQKLSAVEGR